MKISAISFQFFYIGAFIGLVSWGMAYILPGLGSSPESVRSLNVIAMIFLVACLLALVVGLVAKFSGK